MKKSTKTLLLAIITILILVLVACAVFYTGKPSAPISKPTTPTVSVSALSEQVMPIRVSSYGQVISPVSMVVKAQASGLLTAIHFKPGAAVQRGQLLFTLNTSDGTAQLKKLAAQMELSKQIYTRTQRLSKLADGGVSTVDVLTAKLNYEQNLAQYQQALAIYNVTSPITGVVTDTNLAAGDYVNAGDTLAKVIDPKSLEVSYQLPSRYAKLAHVGQPVIFTTADNGQHYAATVSYVAPIISDNLVSIALRATFTDAPTLLANRFGEVSQSLEENHRALAIPQGLVQNDSGGFYVFLFKAPKVFKQYFTAGELTKAGFIEVASGLQVGDLLITTNPNSLQDGQTVKVEK